ncbi:MAG TPA: AAA family ATPase [Nitrososphaeraceae archaeon]|nr:AAA family ATPase [Nitrososphaeraceae archaeon]
MSKILILSGISNSGKSNYAAKLVQEHPQAFIIVSRDILRYMYGYTEETVKEYYLRSDFNYLENQITAVQGSLINFWLKRGKDVIIDNTNLKKSYIEEFNKFGVPTEVKFFDITLKEALTRNMSRNRKVDEEVIERQYSQYINLRKNFAEIEK